VAGEAHLARISDFVEVRGTRSREGSSSLAECAAEILAEPRQVTRVWLVEQRSEFQVHLANELTVRVTMMKCQVTGW
jgi:hypothetical protein